MKQLLSRQEGIDPDSAAYVDRGSMRIWNKYLNQYGNNSNVTKAACAKELSCFIRGMMIGHMETI